MHISLEPVSTLSISKGRYPTGGWIDLQPIRAAKRVAAYQTHSSQTGTEGNLSEWEGGRTYLSSQIRPTNLCTKLHDSPFDRYFHLDKCETDKPTLLILAILLA